MKHLLPLVKRITNRLLLKLLVIMKLSIALILIAALHADAGVFGQGSITLNMQQAEIQKVLTRIEKQGEFRFLYNYDLESLRKKVDVNVEQLSVKEVLSKIFANTDLTFKILDNNLIV